MVNTFLFWWVLSVGLQGLSFLVNEEGKVRSWELRPRTRADLRGAITLPHPHLFCCLPSSYTHRGPGYILRILFPSNHLDLGIACVWI